jgi:hypothetical protein
MIDSGSSARGAESSAGGSRAAGGLSFQVEVFAWWAAHAVSGIAPGLGLDPRVCVENVGCETGFAVDDVGVVLSDGGYILVQAKSGIPRLNVPPMRAAMDQLVNAAVFGLRAGLPQRPVDVERDRLVIAADHTSSRSFDALRKVCERFRGWPRANPWTGRR